MAATKNPVRVEAVRGADEESGPMPPFANIPELEELACRRLSSNAWGYYSSGAEAQSTLKENRAAFARWLLLPRMMVDVSHIDTRVEILGEHSAIVIRRTRASIPRGTLEYCHASQFADVALVVTAHSSAVLKWGEVSGAPQGGRLSGQS